MERLHPNAQVIALQSEENQALVRSIERYRSDSAAVDPYRDESTKPSIADGTRISGPGELTWRLLKERSNIRGVAVSESEIQRAIFFLFEKCRLLVEGAGALGVAALLSGRVEPSSNSTVVVILSGGNIDITKVASVIESQLTAENRYSTFGIEVEDAPGRLHDALKHFADHKVNIVDLRRVRAPVGLSHSKARLEVIVETNNREDADLIFRALADIASKVHTFEIRKLS